MRNIISIMLLLLLLSCKQEPKIVTENTVQPILEGENMALENIFPKAVSVYDNKLIIIQNYDLPLICIYDLEKKKVISSFGMRKDPISPLFFPVMSGYKTIGKEKTFSLADFKTNKVLTYKLNNVIKSGINAKPINEAWLLPSLNLKYSSLLKISEDTYFANYNGYKKNGRFFIYNTSDKKTKWIPYYPQSTEKIAEGDLSSYYYSYLSYNPDLRLIGAAMKFFKRVDFYKPDGSVAHSSVFSPYDQVSAKYVPSMIQNPNITVYYNESYAGEKFFYASCIDAVQKNYNANIGLMKLHIYDWNGDLKMSVKLDRMFLGGFAVDEAKNRLYIISFLEKDSKNPIIEYQLPKIKQ